MKRRSFLQRCVGAAVGVAAAGLLPAKAATTTKAWPDNFPSTDAMRQIMLNTRMKNWCIDVDFQQQPVEVDINVDIQRSCDLTDIYMSPEALEDIRNWGVDQIDDIMRREILGISCSSEPIDHLIHVNTVVNIG